MPFKKKQSIYKSDKSMFKHLFKNIYLNFGGDLEETYRHETFMSSLKATRYYLIVSIILFAGFAVLDYWAMPYSRDMALYIRFAVVIPGLGIVFTATYMNFFEKYHQLILTAAVLLQGYAYLVMIVVAGVGELAYTSYYPALFIIILLALIFLRLRFYYIFLIILLLVIGYEYVSINIQRMYEGWTKGWELPVLINNNFFFITTNAGFLALGFLLDNSRRKNYLQKLEILNNIKILEKENTEIKNQ